jgi:hypothetical protein
VFKENVICEIFSAVLILCSFLGKGHASYFVVACSDHRSHDIPKEQCYLQIPSSYDGSVGQADGNTHSCKHLHVAITQLTHHHFSEQPLL